MARVCPSSPPSPVRRWLCRIRALLLVALALWLGLDVPFPLWAHALTLAEAGPAQELPEAVHGEMLHAQVRSFGGFYGDGAPQRFLAYVQAGNWRWMAAHPERLPQDDEGREHAWDVLIAASQQLPAADRAGFLEILCALYEEHRISWETMKRALGWDSFARDFITANCDDPHIRGILRRLIATAPPAADLEQLRDWSSGAHADDWWGRENDDYDPPPMPGSLPLFPFKHVILHRVLPLAMVLLAAAPWLRRTRRFLRGSS